MPYRDEVLLEVLRDIANMAMEVEMLKMRAFSALKKSIDLATKQENGPARW